MDYSEICLKDFSLRDYQQDAKEKIFGMWNKVDSILYQMPTGTGKTRLFTSLIRDINVWGLRNGEKKRILIIAHRSELIVQIDKSLEKYHVSHGIIAGSIFKGKKDLTKSVQVASIQTISHGSNYDIASNLNVDFIIIDEAHHSVAASYTKLWRMYPYAKKLGVTASPWRMNNSGFRTVFDAFIPSMSIKDFINKGWLAPYKYYSIPFDSFIMKSIDSITDFDIEGDYKVSALERVMDNNHIRAQLLQSYMRLAKGKKGIIYSISREHSEHICNQYKAIGVNIVCIDSKTPAKLREILVKEFKAGEIDIIVNVDIFSEGFDCPNIEFIQLARPTKSLVKYIQQVGRGLRKNGNKECVILDNVGMYITFGLPDADRDWKRFFEGEETSSSFKAGSSAVDSIPNMCDNRARDISEGQEDMILVQDVIISKSIDDNIQIQKEKNDNNQKNVNLQEIVHDGFPSYHNRQYSVISRVFNVKYRIEENEEGYYLCNTKKDIKCYLGKYVSHSSGAIIIRKIDKDSFMIIRLIPTVKGLEDKEIIIGTLTKEGGILKFSSFDNRIINMSVNI